ncbi:hypothetical protein QE152_g16966 [Popillia japonica]|uniref:Uncharacterized protein n=1 Tax=Popillia japonica TaxID=7064 RepID=A0AAW1L666_POPJA
MVKSIKQLERWEASVDRGGTNMDKSTYVTETFSDELQSLTHNQLSSARFINLFKYAWFKSGCIENRPPKFQAPAQFCFPKDLRDYHYCTNYVA